MLPVEAFSKCWMPRSSSSNMTDKQLNTNQLELTKRKQNVILVVLLALWFISGMVRTIPAPFYPEEAISRNMTATEYGFVSGSFDITQCIVSVPLGIAVHVIGPKLAILSGTCVTGLGMLIFGFLKFCDGRILFFTFSFVLRILEGFGKTLLHQGTLNMVSTAVSRSSTFTITWLESAFAIGLVISPQISGLLYDGGGFLLPFIALGTVTMLTLPFCRYILPSDQALKSIDQDEKSLNWKVLTVINVWFGFLVIVSGIMPMAFFISHIGPHLDIFQLTATYRGMILYTLGLFYAGSSPFWGKLCDRWLDIRWCILIATLFSFVGICLVGPAPFIPLQKSLPLIISGVVLTGLGIGGSIPLSYVYSRQACDKKRIPNNTSSNAMLTGIHYTGTGFGSFTGSFFAGAVYDTFGFAGSSMIPVTVNAITIILGFLIYLKDQHEEKNRV